MHAALLDALSELWSGRYVRAVKSAEQALALESTAELKALLTRLLIERLKVQETQAIASAQIDPGALERYRALQARRRSLEIPPEV